MKIELPGARPPELEPPCAEPRSRKSWNRWEQDNAMSSRHQKMFFRAQDCLAHTGGQWATGGLAVGSQAVKRDREGYGVAAGGV